MRVETTIERVEEGQSIPVKEIRTSNSKLCGHPGEYIIVPPCFFNSSCPEVNEYGDRGKLNYQSINLKKQNLLDDILMSYIL